MKSVFWLIPDQIAGRPGPVHSPWVAAELRAGGLSAVLNLSEREPDRAELEAAGFTVGWVPLPTDIPAIEATERWCLDALPRALEFLTIELAAGRRVLVHCRAGRDRTGLVLALYLAGKESLPAAEAIRRVRLARPDAIAATGWEAMALRVIPQVLAKK
jgi:protein-tyrosine phosphatase